MSSLVTTPVTLFIREHFGLAHERQILEIDAPETDCCTFRDAESGELFPFQRSQADPSRGFVSLRLEPFQSLDLRESDELVETDNVVEVSFAAGVATLANGLVALRVPLGEWQSGGGTETVPGPLEAFQLAGDRWRGRTFLEVRDRVSSRRGWLEETGPLRVVACYRVELEGGGFYESRITLDAGQILATVAEKWSGGAGDQIVWDFAGEDFPEQLLLLDSTAGCTTRKIQPHFDQRHARLWCWTQQTQLHDLKDGFALKFGADLEAPLAGFIVLDGGSWQGNRLNHLEAWTRRWWREDPFSRRGEGWESKADSLPSSDAIAFRGESIGSSHFNVEGWLAESGQRSFALVLAREKDVCPPVFLESGGQVLKANPFENAPAREKYAAEQSRLRRIHIQRGLFPFGAVTAIDVSAEAGAVQFQPGRVGYQSSIVEEHLRHSGTVGLEERKAWMLDYLAARVFGFWESGGLAYTNPVSSRGIAPALFLFEFLASEGHLTPEEEATARAQLLFLATLFHSDNCYPGESTMQPLGAPNGVEPTLAGMANQNFFTDVFNTYGLAAQIFPHHPDAPKWRESFDNHWRRQLEYHTYPESGVWEESHTYYQHVLHTLLPTCLRRREAGVADDFANPRFQNMVRGALLQITPRDVFTDGARHLVAFGDHHADIQTYGYLYRELAHAFAPQKGELAAQLAWLYREMNGREPLRVEPKPVIWESGAVQGLGYFFRTTEKDGTQNLLALRSGGAWAHHHHDEGSIQFFAAGRALIVDAAHGHVPRKHARKFMASGHSRWSPAGEEPLNYFWRFNRGEIVASERRGPIPFAVAHDPVAMTALANAVPRPLAEPISHTRRVIQVAPSAFVIVDECDTDIPQVARFHLPLTDFEIDDKVLRADYPAVEGAEVVRLTIAALNGDGPTLGEIDVPDRKGWERFSTQEMVFPARNGGAILICAQPKEAPLHLGEYEFEGQGWRFALADLD